MIDSVCGQDQMAVPFDGWRVVATHSTFGPISTLAESSERLGFLNLVYVMGTVNFDVILRFFSLWKWAELSKFLRNVLPSD
jgi:hypothetical protein